MERKVPTTVNIEYIGGKNVMPIEAYWGPHPHHWMEDDEDYKGKEDPYAEMINDEYFKMIKECGINIIEHSNTDYTKYPEEFRKSLELASKYGIGYIVLDEQLVKYSKDENADLDKIAERVAEYKDYPAYMGFYVVDEPKSKTYDIGFQPHYIEDFKHAIKKYRSLNLAYRAEALPIYTWYDDEEMQHHYRNYINEFCEVFQPEVLLFDHYPFVNDVAPRMDIYFWNLSVVREYAEKYNIPFGVTVQAGGQWNDDENHFRSLPYYPNEGQFTWNVNTNLAMGAKTMVYFPLVQPYHFAWAEDGEHDFDRNGLFGGDGRKTQWYYYAQKMNKQIAAIDEVLMNSVSEGVIVSGAQAKEDLKATNCVIASGVFEQLTGVKGDALIGCFNYDGKTALYVVNYSMEYEQNVTLEFSQNCHIRMIKNAEASCMEGERLNLYMSAGEGVLLVIE